MQILALMLATLHWKGSKNIPGKKPQRLGLSIGVAWRADGDFQFVVIWSSDTKDYEHKVYERRWECHEGVYWFRAERTKYTKKDNYIDIQTNTNNLLYYSSK